MKRLLPKEDLLADTQCERERQKHPEKVFGKKCDVRFNAARNPANVAQMTFARTKGHFTTAYRISSGPDTIICPKKKRTIKDQQKGSVAVGRENCMSPGKVAQVSLPTVQQDGCTCAIVFTDEFFLMFDTIGAAASEL